MATLVAFLRGVNVGGISIKMTELARTFEELGFTDVKTILASGNVRFEANERNGPALKQKIEAALTRRFGYEAWVIILDAATIRRVIAGYPFDEHDAHKQPYVMLLADPRVLDDLLSIEPDLDAEVDRVQRGNGVLYWEVKQGETLGSAFGKHIARPKFKALVTTRNMRTMRKLLDEPTR